MVLRVLKWKQAAPIQGVLSSLLLSRLWNCNEKLTGDQFKTSLRNWPEAPNTCFTAHTHTRTHCFSWRDCTSWAVTRSQRSREWFCVSSPRDGDLFSPRASVLSIPSAPESVSCVRTGSPPLPPSAQTLIKGQHRPGCNRKQIQPESPSSRNMLSTGKRLTFQKHELCKKKRKLRQRRSSTWSFASAMCRQRKGGRGVRSVQGGFYPSQQVHTINLHLIVEWQHCGGRNENEELRRLQQDRSVVMNSSIDHDTQAPDLSPRRHNMRCCLSRFIKCAGASSRCTREVMNMEISVSAMAGCDVWILDCGFSGLALTSVSCLKLQSDYDGNS